MNPEPTYLPPVALGDPMRGIVCGTVTESRHPDFATGDIVSGIGQWAEYQIGTPETLNKLDPGPLPLAVSMATENCTLLATENCTRRGESCRAERTFSR